MAESDRADDALFLGFETLSFRSFTKWTQPEEFGRLTFIYGHNGSGKTTLADALRQMRRSDGDPFGRLRCREGLSPEELHFEIFTQSYVTDSVSSFEGGDADPVWTLDEDMAERKRSIDDLRSGLERAKGRVKALAGQLSDRQSALEKQERSIRDELQRLGDLTPAGMRDFGKATVATVRSVWKGYNTAPSRPEDEGSDASDRVLAQGQASLHEVGHPPSSDEIARVRSAFEQARRLPDEWNLDTRLDDRATRWIREGFSLHESSTECKFCGGDYSSARRDLINAALMTGEVKECVRKAQGVRRQAKSLIKSLQGAAGVFSQPGFDSASPDATKAKAEADEAITRLETLRDLAGQLADNPRVSVPDAPEVPDVPFLRNVTDQHSRRAKDRARAQREAGGRVLDRIVSAHWEAYSENRDKVAEAEGNLNKAQAEQEDLEEQLKNWKEVGWESGSGAVSLNKDLHAYLGHEDLEVEARPDGYRIARNGVSAAHLSEGERTALGLLHFISCIVNPRRGESDQEHSDRMARTVVWIDDPITSLDAGSKILAAEFIVRRLGRSGRKRPRQLVVSTHDAAFLSLLHGSFQRQQPRPRLLLLTRGNERLRPLSEELMKSQNALFVSDIVDALQSAESQDHRRALNSARRLVESYVRWHLQRGDLTGGFQRLAARAGVASEAAKAVVKSLHLGSHATDDPHATGLDEIGAYAADEVLRTVLAVINRVDEDQFKRVWSVALPDGPTFPEVARAPAISRLRGICAEAAGVTEEHIRCKPDPKFDDCVLVEFGNDGAVQRRILTVIENLPTELRATQLKGRIRVVLPKDW